MSDVCVLIQQACQLWKRESCRFPAYPLLFVHSATKLQFEIGASSLPLSLHDMKGGRRRQARFSSLSGKASQQARYWTHPPGEWLGQCNREQGTILDHLTIISKCTQVAISAGPPWECSFCSQLRLRFILLHRNLVMQIALITPGLTTGEEAGGVLEHAAVLTRWLFRQI